MELLTHKNEPFGPVGLDYWGNPPGYNTYGKLPEYDYIPPCDQYSGGTWLQHGTYTYSRSEWAEHERNK